MATSGTTTFDLQIDDILEEAFEMLGGEYSSANESKSARRSLNLLLKDLENRGLPLANLELRTYTVTESTAEETLDTDVIDVLDVVIRRDSTDYSMERMSLFEYNAIPVKTQEGRPFSYTLERDKDAAKMTLWLTPDGSTDQIRYYALTKIEDVTRSNQNIDLVARYLPAITAGLAYFLSFKRDIPLDRAAFIKQDYEEKITRALNEDSERSTFIAAPRLNSAGKI